MAFEWSLNNVLLCFMFQLERLCFSRIVTRVIASPDRDDTTSSTSLKLYHRYSLTLVAKGVTVAAEWQLLLLLSRFSRVRLCATPETAAHQASPSLGFSRQEHWSGLPFPSPIHESEKWKWSRSVVPDSATPWTAAYQAPPSMGFSRQEYWSGVPLPSPALEYNCSC